jgi:hypothetical protein
MRIRERPDPVPVVALKIDHDARRVAPELADTHVAQQTVPDRDRRIQMTPDPGARQIEIQPFGTARLRIGGQPLHLRLYRAREIDGDARELGIRPVADAEHVRRPLCRQQQSAEEHEEQTR